MTNTLGWQIAEWVLYSLPLQWGTMLLLQWREDRKWKAERREDAIRWMNRKP